jgi:hypothetical protein
VLLIDFLTFEMKNWVKTERVSYVLMKWSLENGKAWVCGRRVYGGDVSESVSEGVEEPA